ncbi:uncharacterized protein LOC144168126 [Haemaphysalis longicornis]
MDGDKNERWIPDPFSGRGSSYVMLRLPNTLRLFAQVSTCTPLYSRKSNNLCLLLFPRPGVLLSELCECYSVIRQLILLSGDVELNPGPSTRTKDSNTATDTEQKTLNDMFSMLQSVNDRTANIEKSQSELLNSVNEVIKGQEATRNTIKDIDKRLTAVEAKTSASDAAQQELVELRQLADRLSTENSKIPECQAEMEDRIRRDNLLFYGVSDEPLETWDQAENKILEVMSASFDFTVSKQSIERAHRLGLFSDEKCRPVVVKFSSFKFKQQVLNSSANLKDKGVTVSEDYSVTTRQARKKLAEFGKTQNSTYKLRYNKLYVNDKCYCYNHVDGTMFEQDGFPMQPPSSRQSDSAHTMPQHSDSAGVSNSPDVTK